MLNTELRQFEQFHCDRTALEVGVSQDVVDGRMLFHRRSQVNDAYIASTAWGHSVAIGVS